MGIPDSLPHKLTLIQISRSSFSLPTDVILKLAGGNIEAHRSILAAVSPVFEKMFYGNLKEGKSMTVDLPKDSSEILSYVIDFVYHGSCELKNLDNIFQILEAFDRYQINKVPFYHMCGEVILTQMESSNYLYLLQKFAKVMNEEGIRKAANKVMLYTNDDFIAKFDDNKDLPEEIMLQLLQIDTAHHEIEIFDFLEKWHDYQTNNLGKSLQLTQKLFQSVRYSLIIPQLLTAKVLPRSDLINKQLLLDAYHYIYNSCKPLGEYHSSECTMEPAGLKLRKPRCLQEIQWSSNQATLQHDKLNEYKVSFYSSNTNVIMTSSPLRNGIYTCSILNITATHNNEPYTHAPISIAVSDKQGDKYLYSYPLANDSMITAYVHNDFLFLKLIQDDKVKVTVSLLETDIFRICVRNLIPYNQYACYYCSFDIHNHLQ